MFMSKISLLAIYLAPCYLSSYLYFYLSRYYGKSAPVEDMSDINMKFLSSRQGLEDLATFITAMSQVLTFIV